jgi:phage gp46-like protein
MLISTGDGGDYVITDNNQDLQKVTGFQNMVYLALFGGNIEQSTKTYDVGETRFDWWGNTYFQQTPAAQMNSRTERLLRDSALTSQARLQIEQAVKQDLTFMQEFAEVGVSVTFPELDRVKIVVNLDKPTQELSNQFTFLWDNSKQEVTLNDLYLTL